MGQLANDIFAAAGTNIPATPTPTGMSGPALLRVFASVETAVGALELLTRGAHILRTAGRPDDAADGADGDLALNTANADLYAKASGAWALVLNLRGVPGKDAASQAGQSAYQLAVQQGFAGTLDQWLASLGRAGADGKSAYAVATANGFVGTVTQWLATLKGDAAAAAQLPPDSVTNSLLGPDVKVGSLSAAGNAYPAADRASLTTVEKFLVWIGPKVTDLYTRIGNVETSFGKLSDLVNGFAARIGALESRPTGGSGGGSGGGSATYPAQSLTTVNQYLQSTGTAGAERWASPLLVLSFQFLNLTERHFRFFNATTLTRIVKDAGVATLSYSLNGATAVAVAFTGGVFTGSIAIPAGTLVAWVITYPNTVNEGYFDASGIETITA